MTSGFTPRARGLALGLTLALGCLPAQAGLFDKPDKKTARNFLPPVATINGKLEHAFQPEESGPFEPIVLTAVSAPVLRAGTPVKKLDNPLTLRPEDEFMALVTLRQEQDEADLDRLWEATVERNPVIRFSLEKLMTPADLQTRHSAMFSKVVSTLIQGAALGSQMFLPGSGYQDMGIMAVGQAANNIVTGKNKPQGPSLSATEQIQLAGLIDELKGKLIQTYTHYKNTLQLLAEARQTTVKNNNLYSKALASNNGLAMMAASSAYYQALLHETELRQKARLYQVQLERLAGPEAVQELELAVAVPESLRQALPTQMVLQEAPSPTASLSAPAQIPPPASAATASSDEPIGPLALPTVEEATPRREGLIGPSIGPSQEMIGPTLELAPDILPFSSQLPPSSDVIQ